jgi:hypothetical protein
MPILYALIYDIKIYGIFEIFGLEGDSTPSGYLTRGIPCGDREKGVRRHDERVEKRDFL